MVNVLTDMIDFFMKSNSRLEKYIGTEEKSCRTGIK